MIGLDQCFQASSPPTGEQDPVCSLGELCNSGPPPSTSPGPPACPAGRAYDPATSRCPATEGTAGDGVNYDFKFNGCCRGPATSRSVHVGTLGREACEARCTMDPGCNEVEVSPA